MDGQKNIRHRFQLLSKLGEGGMGVVYEAYDRDRDMIVAVKRLSTVSADGIQRFKREFRALNDFHHHNVITLYELVCDGSDWFLVMELLKGCDFIGYVRAGQSAAELPDNMGPITSVSSTRSLSADVFYDDPFSASATALAATRTSGIDQLDSTKSENATTALAATRTSGIDQLDSIKSENATAVERCLPLPPRELTHVTGIVNLKRLRDAAIQLASALSALHAANIVHRDIKPSNIIVSEQGWVVLTDFGIVAELSQPIRSQVGRLIIGSPSYMAPEQARGELPTPAADWYAFGVILYLALTNRLPYQGGTPMDLVLAKQQHDPIPISQFVAECPSDLEHLCMRLLSREPGARPSADEVLLHLHGGAQAHRRATSAIGLSLFVGRDHDLATLRSAYDDVCAGAARFIVVEGSFGIGKSALVAEFCKELENAIFLQSRCHERESLPYKAFDGAIDMLCTHLIGLEPGERARLLPDSMPLLARLFPVLQQLPECSSAVATDESPVVLRILAAAALRTLLSQLGRDQPVVLYIEDLHWADRDSIHLLLQLMQPSLPARVLVIATRRSVAADNPESGPNTGLIATLCAHERCQRLELGPLSHDEQQHLLRRMRSHGLSEQLVRSSAGHPMLLAELVRYVREAPGTIKETGTLDLDDILWQRVCWLPDQARQLLEMIAVAVEALPPRVLGKACGISDAELERAQATLRNRHLLHLVHREQELRLIAYHDRVRDTILSHLSQEHMRALHERLAKVLEEWEGASLTARARHWAAAGQPARAVRYLVDAAHDAAKQFAIEYATALFRDALTLLQGLGTTNGHEHLYYQAWVGFAEGMRIVGADQNGITLLEHIWRSMSLSIHEQANVHYLLGSLLYRQGDVEGCLREHMEALRCAQDAGSKKDETRALGGLGDACFDRGKIGLAHRYYDRCISLARQSGFDTVARANLPMRGLCYLYHNQLSSAYQDCVAAVEMSEQASELRGELVARSALAIVLIDMGALQQAQSEVEALLGLSKRLQAQVWSTFALAFHAQILAADGQPQAAQTVAENAVALCRSHCYSFMGPLVFATHALVVDDRDAYRRALDEGEALVTTGSAPRNYLYFYREATAAALRMGEPERAHRYAHALSNYRPEEEPLPWVQFFSARGRALAEFASGQRTPELIDTLRHLRDRAYECGFMLAVRAIESALEAAY